MNNIVQIIVFVLISLSVLTLIHNIIILIKTMNNKINNDINICNSKMNATSLEECNQMIDGFISREFDNYCAKNLNFRNLDVISDKQQDMIRRDLLKLIQERMSTNILYKMSLFYEVDKIPDIIAEKVYLLVTAYVINIYNTPSREEERAIMDNLRKKNREMYR